MEEFLQSPVFKVLVGLIVAGVILKTAAKYLFPPKQNPMSRKARCKDCGWTGAVGKYNKVCSKCNSTNLAIRAGG